MLVRIIALAMALLASGQALAQQESAFYSDVHCGVRFDIPSGWKAETAKTDGRDEICRILVYPANLDALIKKDGNLDLYTIEVTTLHGDFQQAATRAAFEHKGDGWVLLGRTDIATPAERTSSDHWIGLKGTTTMGCYEVNSGPYVGLCDVPRAMFNNRKQLSAIVQGGSQSGDQFDSVLASLKFLNSD